MLILYISCVNDHTKEKDSALGYYIDPRWLFAILKKQNIHPKFIMGKTIYNQLFWRAIYLEENPESKFRF